MKRVIVYFMYLWILLLGGGSEFAHAATLPKRIVEIHSLDVVKKHHVKYKKMNSSSVLVDDVDLDIDEEFQNGNTLSKADFGNFIVNKPRLLNKWYLIFSSQYNLKDYNKQNLIVTSPCGYYNPIYITIGDFRI